MSQFQICPSKEISPGRKILFREGHPPLMGYWFFNAELEKLLPIQPSYVYSVPIGIWLRFDWADKPAGWQRVFMINSVPIQYRTELLLLL